LSNKESISELIINFKILKETQNAC